MRSTNQVMESAAPKDRSQFLRIRGITKQFGNVVALQSVDLDVTEGEFLTLLGPSGCGKSTLLRLVSGFDRPSEGTVEFRGSDMKQIPPERRPFNMVFQSYALFPHMTVLENISYGLRVRGMPSKEVARRAKEMLELIQLAELGDRKVYEMSGGQQQRVALGRALVNQPEVLLLDEPLGALDLQLRKRLQDELRTIQRQLGTTFIYVTHDQEEALTLSHRIAVVEKGQIVQLSPPQELYEHPASSFVARFVGETNLLECRVMDVDGDGVVVKFGNGATCRLHQYAASSLRTGQEALAVLRPHHLELSKEEGSPFVGSVEQMVFLGTHRRYEVRFADGSTMRVNGPVDGVVDHGEVTGIQVKRGHGAVVPADRGSSEPERDSSPAV